MKKVPFVLFCFLIVGPTPPQKEWTVVLSNGYEYSNVSLLHIDGDRLVATHQGDTIFVPVDEISDVFTRSLVLGLPGCWFGAGVGAIAGAACAAATGPYEAPNGSDLPPETAMGFGASLGGCLGMIGGCIVFPENEERYDLSDKTLDVKKTMINSILKRHGARG